MVPVAPSKKMRRLPMGQGYSRPARCEIRPTEPDLYADASVELLFFRGARQRFDAGGPALYHRGHVVKVACSNLLLV